MSLPGASNPVLKIQGRYRQGFDYPWGINLPPRRWATIDVETWGRRTSTRQDLINACLTAAAAWGFGLSGPINPGDPFLQRALAGYRGEVELDIVDKYASLSMGILFPNWSNLIAAGAQVFTGIYSNSLTLSTFPENIAGVSLTTEDGSIASVPNPPPPNSAGTRGTLLERIVAQTLTNPGSIPAAPVNWPAANPGPSF